MKRLFDIFVSFTGLLILSPLFLILSLLIVIDSRGGVFFRQARVGKNGKMFRIFKFRSMKPNSENKGSFNVSDKDDRITRVGHFLRKSKLDELPQLINVFIGNMSLVGPRPELKVYVDMYEGDERRVLDLKPGITDWASLANMAQYKQITASSDPDAYYVKVLRPLKVKLQLYYWEHHSLFNDFSCLMWTAIKVITRSKKLPKKVQRIVDEHYAELEKEDAEKTATEN